MGSGEMPFRSGAEKIVRVANELKDMSREVQEFRSANSSDDAIDQLSDPMGSEMLTRWDMMHSAPDILVTNYSMLNAMLMREQEETVFKQTKDWINADPNNIFHLVIDELHLYRHSQNSKAIRGLVIHKNHNLLLVNQIIYQSVFHRIRIRDQFLSRPY